MHQRVSLARLLNFDRAALTTIWAFGQVDMQSDPATPAVIDVCCKAIQAE
jgi:hypothetical protein